MKMNTTFKTTCKNPNEYLTLEEKFVLGIVKPDEYTEAIIKAIRIAMCDEKKLGYAAQLAAIHPELAHAVNCLLNGNLQEVYRAHKARQAELLAELGF